MAFGMLTGMLVISIVIGTCCLAGILFAIPYVGTVVMLPVPVFFRSFSVYFLQQFHPDYRIMQEQSPPPVTANVRTQGVEEES